MQSKRRKQCASERSPGQVKKAGTQSGQGETTLSLTVVRKKGARLCHELGVCVLLLMLGEERPGSAP